LITYFRGLLMLNISDELSGILSQNYTKEELTQMSELAQQFSRNCLTSIMRKLIEAQDKMKFSDFPHVYLEMAIAESTIQDELTKENKNDKDNDSNVGGNSNEDSIREQNQKHVENNKLDNDVCNSEISKEQWNAILTEIKKKNHSVHAFLSACIPVKIVNNDLLIFVKHNFHKERLNTQQNKILVESAISSVMGSKLGSRCLFKEELDVMGIEADDNSDESANVNNGADNVESGDVISEALEMFGGSVVS